MMGDELRIFNYVFLILSTFLKHHCNVQWVLLLYGILKNDIEMKITLKIEESKIELFMRLIKGLEFVELVKDESDIPLWQQEEIDKRLKDLEQNP